MSLTLNYGTRLLSKDSSLFSEIYEVEAAISRFRSTSENLQDFFPILRYLRNPLKQQNTYAREIGDRRKAFNYKLLDELAHRISQGQEQACIQSNVMSRSTQVSCQQYLLIQAYAEDPDVRLSKSELLGVSLSIVAGADSSTPTTGWIIAYLIRHPEWQDKLHNELKTRWADHIHSSWAGADETEIPLFDAFIKEILRFFPPLRSGIPRAAYQDVAYERALIPAGTTTLLNIWACNRGELCIPNHRTLTLSHVSIADQIRLSSINPTSSSQKDGSMKRTRPTLVT